VACGHPSCAGCVWVDVDIDRRDLHVRQRADRYKAIGPPKSESGERTVPMLPLVANALKELEIGVPEGRDGPRIPNPKGNVESYNNIVLNGLLPAQVAAGVAVTTVDGEGKPVVQAKYTGLHALRHFYASWCINRKATAGWSCRRRWFRNASGTQRSR